jgi:Mn-dependent DtxR family transcriptional regulator
MTFQQERYLLVFIYIDQKGSASLNDIRSEIKSKDDPDFDFDTILNDMAKQDYVEQSEDLSWKITERGDMEFNDLKSEKQEDLNKIPIIIVVVVIVIAIISFIRLFPKMFH